MIRQSNNLNMNHTQIKHYNYTLPPGNNPNFYPISNPKNQYPKFPSTRTAPSPLAPDSPYKSKSDS